MEKTEKIQAIRRALETRNMLCVKFEKNASSVEFRFMYSRGQGLEDWVIWLPIEEALPLLAGYAFEQIL